MALIYVSQISFESEVKGKLWLKKKFSSNERAWEMQKNEPLMTSMRQVVLEVSHFKARNLSKMMNVAIL